MSKFYRCYAEQLTSIWAADIGIGLQSVYSGSHKCYEISKRPMEMYLTKLLTVMNVLFVECDDLELLCNVLAVADQFLIGRFKDICETAIAQQCM